MPKFVDVVKNANSTTTIVGDELFPIIQGGLTKKISIAELQAGPFSSAVSPSILHSVIGAPSDTLGNDGDYAIDTYYKMFYGPKTNSLWPVGFSMVGPTGATGAAGADGVGIPSGGTAGQVLAKIDGTDYNSQWVNSITCITDTTSASPDYSLAVGEVAKITYSSSTSVALNIATVADGEYELILRANTLPSSPTNGNVALRANNTTYTNAFNRQYHFIANGNGGQGQATESDILIGVNGAIQSRVLISTRTGMKAALSNLMGRSNDNTYTEQNASIVWGDTSTVWSSLGTVAFPGSSSGTIIVRRIL